MKEAVKHIAPHTGTWERKQWPGSDEVTEAYQAFVKNPCNGRKTEVWIWMSDGWKDGTWVNYTVSGAGSDYSHTGSLGTNIDFATAADVFQQKYQNQEIFK